MQRQESFADLIESGQRRRTRRAEFLEAMDGMVPWAEWVALVEPHYPGGARGRRPVGCERMLRMYLLSVWFRLSDEACEDAVLDSRAMQRFVGLDMMSEQVPDATTLCKFRHLLEREGLGEAMLSSLAGILEGRGVMMRGGSIVDATFVDAPSSTKNRSRSRDPEAHSARKGSEWHFGFKAHVGADLGTGLVHTVAVTAANVADVEVAHRLVRPGDGVCYADAGYAGVAGRPEVAGDPALSAVEWRVARRRGRVPGLGHPEVSWERRIEGALASVRARVEHPFRVVKGIFGWERTRYRGLAKNSNLLCVAFALADLAMLSWSGRAVPPAPEGA